MTGNGEAVTVTLLTEREREQLRTICDVIEELRLIRAYRAIRATTIAILYGMIRMLFASSPQSEEIVMTLSTGISILIHMAAIWGALVFAPRLFTNDVQKKQTELLGLSRSEWYAPLLRKITSFRSECYEIGADPHLTSSEWIEEQVKKETRRFSRFPVTA